MSKLFMVCVLKAKDNFYFIFLISLRDFWVRIKMSAGNVALVTTQGTRTFGLTTVDKAWLSMG